MRLIAGRVNGSERGRLDGHLAQCDRCALFVAEVARGSGSAPVTAGDSLRPPVLLPGMVIANRYHVRRLLGAGAMGEVHEVDDNLLGTVVALKTLNAGLAGDATALARLRREVAAARRVTHRNVCRIFDLGTDQSNDVLGSFVFLTMEYLPGVTLSRFLRAHGRFDVSAALPLLLQLAEALAAAHAAGVIHRDLKTDNIMIVEQDDGAPRAVIMDFGLASFALNDEAVPERGSAFSGTLAYAAPERFQGARASDASDVYSFGLIAAEMLTNRGPHASPPSEVAEMELPPGWRSFLAGTVEIDPEKRLPHGAAVLSALRRLGTLPQSSARRWWSGVAAAVVVAGLTGAAFNASPDSGPERGDVLADAPPRAPAPAPTRAAAMPIVPAEHPRVATAGSKRVHNARRTPRSAAAPPVQRSGDESVKSGGDDLVRTLRAPVGERGDSIAGSDEDLVNPFATRSAQQVEP